MFSVPHHGVGFGKNSTIHERGETMKRKYDWWPAGLVVGDKIRINSHDTNNESLVGKEGTIKKIGKHYKTKKPIYTVELDVKCYVHPKGYWLFYDYQVESAK